MQNEKKEIVWVTGGTKGIGLETTKKLVENGFQVVISSRTIPENRLKDVTYLKCDVSKIDQIAYTYAEIKSKFGSIDILINNAGKYLVGSTKDICEDDYDSVFDTNVKGALFTIKSVLPDMLLRKKGAIININSIASEKTFPNAGLYSASKSALQSISNSLREEVRSKGIDIIDILPGATITDAWDLESIDKFGDQMMKAEDVASAILELILLNKNQRLIPEKLVVRPKSGDL